MEAAVSRRRVASQKCLVALSGVMLTTAGAGPHIPALPMYTQDVRSRGLGSPAARTRTPLSGRAIYRVDHVEERELPRPDDDAAGRAAVMINPGRDRLSVHTEDGDPRVAGHPACLQPDVPNGKDHLLVAREPLPS